MAAQENIEITDVPAEKRHVFEWILEESFEGWYLWHSKKTLRDVELVRAAMSSGRPLGLVMLKSLEGTVGYVYYIAVAGASRNKGVGKLLLENARQLVKATNLKEVCAGV